VFCVQDELLTGERAEAGAPVMGTLESLRYYCLCAVVIQRYGSFTAHIARLEFPVFFVFFFRHEFLYS